VYVGLLIFRMKIAVMGFLHGGYTKN
jgi:hypothetical protein